MDCLCPIGADLLEAGDVTGECGGVTADVDDCTGWLLGELVHHIRREACPRGIDHDDVGLGVGELTAGVSADGFRVIEAGRLEVAPEVADGGT